MLQLISSALQDSGMYYHTHTSMVYNRTPGICDLYMMQFSDFKCPGYYCTPYRNVCNGKWDCPWGTDEVNCERRTCPGLFKCKDSVTCVSLFSLCDGILDCRFVDDEQFCHPAIPVCPMNCSCLLQVGIVETFKRVQDLF